MDYLKVVIDTVLIVTAVLVIGASVLEYVEQRRIERD